MMYEPSSGILRLARQALLKIDATTDDSYAAMKAQITAKTFRFYCEAARHWLYLWLAEMVVRRDPVPPFMNLLQPAGGLGGTISNSIFETIFATLDVSIIAESEKETPDYGVIATALGNAVANLSSLMAQPYDDDLTGELG
jgi:hypothetical protein